MIYTGNIGQRHMAAFLDQLPADQYAAEHLDRSMIEMAGRVSRACIRGVVTGILAGDERLEDWDVLRALTSYEQAGILERGNSRERAAEIRRAESAQRQSALMQRRKRDQMTRAIKTAHDQSAARADAGDDPNSGAR